LEHVPARADRGPVVGFYAVAHLKDGGHAFEFMSVEQIEEIREQSQGWQQAVKYSKQGNHPWKKHFVQMGRKTAIRRLMNYLPLSIEIQTAMESDGNRVDVGALSDPNTVDGELNWLNDSETDPETGETSPPALTDDPSETLQQPTQAATARDYERATKG
jgi:recombination protein RecT